VVTYIKTKAKYRGEGGVRTVRRDHSKHINRERSEKKEKKKTIQNDHPGKLGAKQFIRRSCAV